MMRLTFSRLLVLIFFALALAGCTLDTPSGGPAPTAAISIYEPADGTQYQLGDLVKVRSLVSAPDGAAGVELLVNGQFIRSDNPDPVLKSGTILQPWQPTETGLYALQTRMTTASGVVLESATVTIQVGAAETAPDTAAPTTAIPAPEDTITPTLTPSITPSPTLGPPMVMANENANCRFGPGQVYDVISYLNQDQSAPITGRNAETTWWVIERVDGGGTCWIWDGVVTVSGDTSNVPIVEPPPTPTPTPTQTPSPVPLVAPKPIAPSGSLSCTSTVFLEWQPVSHPNGIGYYEWKVTYSGVTDSGTTTSTSVEYFVTCIASYSWQVRAVDGKGNIGPYSESLSFDIK
ncbi:MAG: hypothetical protein AB1649_34000 [Chloroflexota bacterium]